MGISSENRGDEVGKYLCDRAVLVAIKPFGCLGVQRRYTLTHGQFSKILTS